jgi:ubiquinone/menaquinone biosynthesis C-methylase UbiE
VRNGILLVLAVEARRDPVVERKGVPGEPSSRPERRGDALEGAAAVGPGRQMEESSERAIDQRRGLVEGKVTHIALMQVELDASLGRAHTGLLEHRRRRVDADHRSAGRLRDRDRDPPISDRKLDERPVRLACELDIEGDVPRHVSRPFLVAARERLVPTHRAHATADPIIAAASERTPGFYRTHVQDCPMRVSDRSKVKAYYAALGEGEWKRLERPTDGAVEYAVTLAALERHLTSDSAILDIGGGPGRYAIALAERGHRVTLADLSPELLKIAREKVGAAHAEGRVSEMVEADACDLSRWEAGSFDAALSLGPFYHLTEAREREVAARELARVVRPGGHVFVAAMSRLAFLQRTIALPDERHHLLDAEWLRTLLEDGVFQNEVPGRLSLGYGVETGEIERLFERNGFALLELISAESVSIGLESQVGEVIETGGPIAEAMMRLIVDLADDPRLLGTARHLLFVGRRR